MFPVVPFRLTKDVDADIKPCYYNLNLVVRYQYLFNCGIINAGVNTVVEFVICKNIL
jgi:hypothetical protein